MSKHAKPRAFKQLVWINESKKFHTAITVVGKFTVCTMGDGTFWVCDFPQPPMRKLFDANSKFDSFEAAKAACQKLFEDIIETVYE